MFKIYQLSFERNPYKTLVDCINYEKITNDRYGTVIVKEKDGKIPLVRTTTKYKNPAQLFKPIHFEIIKKIQNETGLNIEFNNGLCEIYGQGYRKMGEHSDQALDLDKDSYICLFSCYNEPNHEIRTLKVREKCGDKKYSFNMDQYSVILFSVKENAKHIHKIILDKISSKTNIKWVGITFRCSKCYINYKDGIPYMPNGSKLKLACGEEKKKFYKLRGKENKEILYDYPECNYTISSSDLMEVK